MNETQRSSAMRWKSLGMGIVMARNTLKRLDDVTGKYHVKALSIGTVLKTDK